MKQLDEYFRLKEEIHNYFGYVEDWVAIPLDDRRSNYWQILGGEGRGGEVQWSPNKDFDDDNEIYSGAIYTQRFLPKWVYRGPEYTMICVDTQCDGNKFLMVFDNKKEIGY